MKSALASLLGNRVVRHLVGALLVGSLSVLGIASPAMASSACIGGPAPNGHYYGRADSPYMTQNYGAYTDMYVSSGSAYDWNQNGFIEQTLWEGTDNQPTGSDWVESGYTYGWQFTNTFTYYWADWRPTYNYAEHRITAVTPKVGTWMPVEIQYQGNNTWNVYLNFQVEGTSTSNPPSSEQMAAGVESTSQYSQLSTAYVSDLEYYTTTGSWVSPWPSGTYIDCETPANASWVTVDSELQDSFN